MVPKLADFGLSRLVSDEQTRVARSFVGTIGYLPPEYIEKNLISKKLDIFSLGVIMIKIMAGHKGYHNSAKMSSQEFIDLVHENWKNRLQETTGCTAMEAECNQVKRFIEIALDCVHVERKKRPKIGFILTWLNETEHIVGKTDICLPPSFSSDPGSHVYKTETGFHEVELDIVFVDPSQQQSQSSVSPVECQGTTKKFDNLWLSAAEGSGDTTIQIRPEAGGGVLKIEEEFRQLMSAFSNRSEPDRLFDCLPVSLRPTKFKPDTDGRNASPTEHPSRRPETDIYQNPPLIPPRILPILNDISRQLVQSGNHLSCYNIYRDLHALALDLRIRKLGVEALSNDDVQKMQLEDLRAEIANWIYAVRIVVKLLLKGERRICDGIFDGVNLNKGHCFAELTANSIVTLFSSRNVLARSAMSSGNVFVFLDMFDVMRELQPEIKDIYEGQQTEVWEAASSLTKLLARTVQQIFANYEVAVEMMLIHVQFQIEESTL